VVFRLDQSLAGGIEWFQAQAKRGGLRLVRDTRGPEGYRRTSVGESTVIGMVGPAVRSSSLASLAPF